ncbi:ATP-grasp domain-containing protein [Methanogenium sp. S4BF]|uniref:carboxylate--amine ligase n=1 Tax=Methanogenium sp. S4BF TaxID=1789226 RepID=UPI0024166B9B|nr:ATP-grasp domain-containing protein [Methanogenium sp. S4BF]WFN35123.1 ATP-grasp domain-containing protein [Methanogenium sp. S4BF]
MNAVVPTGVGDHIGLAVVRSLGKKKISTTVVSNEKRSMPFYSKYCTKKRIAEYNDEFLSELTENDIIMPNGEDEMLFFAKNAPLYDYSLAFPDYATLETIIDKSHLMRFAEMHHISAPKTFFIDDPDFLHEIAHSLTYPAIIKPNRGRGGRGIVRVDSPDMVEETYANILFQYGPSTIQEYIPFTKRYSSAVLTDNTFEIQRICIIQEKRTYPLNTGPGCFVETVANEEIMNLTFDIMNALKIRGVTELDFVIDERDGKPKLLEINPRFWGSVQCAISAGVDFPFLLYEIATDNSIAVSYDYRAGITGRNVFCNDLRHLLTVLRGRFPLPYKLKTMSDFIKFYQDDAYFIFSSEDIRPFISIFEYYLLRKTDQVRLNFFKEISK